MDRKETEKTVFMDETKQLRSTWQPSWMLVGDFNLIYMARDKNNSNINNILMSHFNLVLKEARTQGATPARAVVYPDKRVRESNHD